METERLLAILKELRKVSTMERAGFRLYDHSINQMDADTAAIKEATRLWRETWLIKPLDEMIAELEGNN